MTGQYHGGQVPWYIRLLFPHGKRGRIIDYEVLRLIQWATKYLLSFEVVSLEIGTMFVDCFLENLKHMMGIIFCLHLSCNLETFFPSFLSFIPFPFPFVPFVRILNVAVVIIGVCDICLHGNSFFGGSSFLGPLGSTYFGTANLSCERQLSHRLVSVAGISVKGIPSHRLVSIQGISVEGILIV